MTKFEAVRELRRRLRITQQEFAYQTRLSTRTVSVYERGKTPTSDGVLFQFARLAAHNDFPDLVDILMPGQPAEMLIDISEIMEMLDQVKEAEQKLAEASAKLRRRLTQRGVVWPAEKQSITYTWDPKDPSAHPPASLKKKEKK